MSSKLIIRTDIDVETLRRRARLERDGRIAARLLAIANALDGMSWADAARAAGMDRQTLRDWVLRFNAEGVDGLCWPNSRIEELISWTSKQSERYQLSAYR